jgi:hypothetical protein
MNEIELLSLMRNDVPCEEITPQVEQAFLEAIATSDLSTFPRRQRGMRGLRGAIGPRARWRLAIAGGLIAALAAGLAATGIRVPDRSPGSGGAATAPSADQPLTLTELAYRASAAALQGRDISPNQWVYREIESYGGVGLSDPRGVRTTDANWMTANGLHCAMWIRVGGRRELSGRECGGVEPSYAQLSSLPSDPAAIDRYLAQPGPGEGATTALRNDQAFFRIGQILNIYALDPKLTATLYRALADIPGVTALNDARTAAGQAGVAFVLPAPPGSGLPQDELILDPASYNLIGWTEIDEVGDQVHGVPAGEMQAASVLEEAFVSGPAVQP